MKLISMVDFVLGGQETADYIKLYDGCFKYANFLKQPLTLGMFVPCDLDGNVLKEPQEKQCEWCLESHNLTCEDCKKELRKYQEAKDRVLFEGFKVYKEKSGLIKVFNSESNIELYLPNNNKVERLAFGKIILTESAKQKIFNT